MYRKMALLVGIVLCFGCLEDPLSGDSEEGAPDSIIGYTFTGVVTSNDGKPTTRRVGDTLTYYFVDANTVRGEGFAKVNTLSWYYTASGNEARIKLQFQDGEEHYILTFTSQRSGTFKYQGDAYGYATGEATGTFTISS